MFDDHRVRDLIIAQTGIEPWRLEMEEIDYGDRCGIFYRSPDGTVRGSVAAKNRSEDDVAQDLVSVFFSPRFDDEGNEHKFDAPEVVAALNASQPNYTEVASFRVPSDMVEGPVAFSVAKTLGEVAVSLAPDYTGRAGRHPALCVCKNCSKRRVKEEKKAARKAAKQAKNG